jgi:hypothetical protein
MRSEAKGLAVICAAALAFMAPMMFLAMLGMPTVVKAQQPTGQICSGGGVTGCYSCTGTATSSGQGCNGTTSPPAGWQVGSCMSTSQARTCTSGTINCGAWINCTTGKATGGNCTTLNVCI